MMQMTLRALQTYTGFEIRAPDGGRTLNSGVTGGSDNNYTGVSVQAREHRLPTYTCLL